MDAGLPRAELRRTVDGLADRSPAIVLVPVAPVVLTVVLVTVVLAVRGFGEGPVGQLEVYALYGVANVIVLLGLVAWLDRGTLAALAPIRRPSRREVAAALVAFPVGLGLYQVTTVINAALGLSFTGMEYALTDPWTVALVGVGGVVVAPVAEEVLFRGLLLGYLLDRGWGPLVAGAAVVVAFVVLHLPNFGAGGAVYVVLWGTLPTALRLYFDDLTGAVLLHALNNAFAYVVVPLAF